MSNLAAVKFNNTTRVYYYQCDIFDLTEGDVVKVDANGRIKNAEFVGYCEPKLVGYIPNKKVLSVVTVNKQYSANGKRNKEQISADTLKLFNFLSSSSPTAKTSTEIAEFMGWTEKSATSHIKTSMKLNNQIINYDYNLYTVRKSKLDKYKMKMEEI